MRFWYSNLGFFFGLKCGLIAQVTVRVNSEQIYISVHDNNLSRALCTYVLIAQLRFSAVNWVQLVGNFKYIG